MSDKITFKELVEKISKSTQQNEQKTNSFIHELVNIIESGLEKGEKITISGFGKFELRWMDQRSGRNPQTGEEITIPEQNRVVFKPYKALREHVNLPFKNLEAQIIEDQPVQHTAVQSTSAAALSVSGKQSEFPGKAREKIDDLIVELPSPVKNKVPASSLNEENSDGHPPIAVASKTKKSATGKNNIQKNPKDDNDKNRFNWSYKAASLVVLLAIFLLIFIIYWPRDSVDQSTPELVDHASTLSSDTPSMISHSSSSAAVEQMDVENETEPPLLGTHAISAGETLWGIAESTYGNPYLWPLIYLNNSDNFDNPNQIYAGGSIDLPIIIDPENLTQNEKEAVARGYLYVYDWMTEHQPDSAKYFLWAVGSFSQEQLQTVSARVNETDLAFAIQR